MKKYVICLVCICLVVFSTLSIMTSTSNNKRGTIFDSNCTKEITLYKDGLDNPVSRFTSKYVSVLDFGKCYFLKEDGSRMYINGTFTIEEFLE